MSLTLLRLGVLLNGYFLWIFSGSCTMCMAMNCVPFYRSFRGESIHWVKFAIARFPFEPTPREHAHTWGFGCKSPFIPVYFSGDARKMAARRKCLLQKSFYLSSSQKVLPRSKWHHWQFNLRERDERFRKYQTDASCSNGVRQRNLSYCRKTAITQLKLIGRTLASNWSIEHTHTFVQSARATLYIFWNTWKIFLKLRNAKFAVSGPNVWPYCQKSSPRCLYLLSMGSVSLVWIEWYQILKISNVFWSCTAIFIDTDTKSLLV